MECILDTKSQLKFLYLLQDFLIEKYPETKVKFKTNYDYYRTPNDFSKMIIWNNFGLDIKIIPNILNNRCTHVSIPFQNNIGAGKVIQFSLENQIDFDLEALMQKFLKRCDLDKQCDF